MPNSIKIFLYFFSLYSSSFFSYNKFFNDLKVFKSFLNFNKYDLTSLILFTPLLLQILSNLSM